MDSRKSTTTDRVQNGGWPALSGKPPSAACTAKPSSVPRDFRRGVTIISLGRRLPDGSSARPASKPTDRGHPEKPSGSCLRLHEVGFAVPRPSPAGRCALTAPFHPYLRPKPKAVCFLWHYP